MPTVSLLHAYFPKQIMGTDFYKAVNRWNVILKRTLTTNEGVRKMAQINEKFANVYDAW